MNTVTQSRIAVGNHVGRKLIQEVGDINFFFGDNRIAGVRFEDGTYGVVTESEGGRMTEAGSSNDEIMQLIQQSSQMPVARAGIGCDVWHIGVWEGNAQVLIKIFYNEKADYRDDEIHR